MIFPPGRESAGSECGATDAQSVGAQTSCVHERWKRRGLDDLVDISQNPLFPKNIFRQAYGYDSKSAGCRRLQFKRCVEAAKAIVI